MPLILSTLQENACTILAVLDWVGAITIPSHAASPIVHIHLHSMATLSVSASASAKPPNPVTPAPRDAQSIRHHGYAYYRTSWTRRSRRACGSRGRAALRLSGQELVEARPSIRLAVTTVRSRKDSERAAGVIKATAAKVPTKRK
ncbi:hypothetical protein EDB86DRAFT_2947742 [Lactarius hatsudake]|nr:hypothetical protein EDB86DRAFT_2947742 [Lactarius hatsudake]